MHFVNKQGLDITYVDYVGEIERCYEVFKASKFKSLELLSEEGGIGLQDFMGLFSQESPEEDTDDSGSFLAGVKLVQELKEADTTEGVVDIGTMFGL